MATFYPTTSAGNYHGGTKYLSRYGVTFYWYVGAYFYVATSSSEGVTYKYSPRMWMYWSGTATQSYTFIATPTTSGSSGAYKTISISKGTTYSSTSTLTLIQTKDTLSTRPYQSSNNVNITGSINWSCSMGSPTTGAVYLDSYPMNFDALYRKWDFFVNGGQGSNTYKSGYYGQTLYTPGAVNKNSSSSTNTSTAIINYNANGGSASKGSDTVSVTTSTSTTYSFKNWNANSSGTGSGYGANAAFTLNSTASWYASWNANSSSSTQGQKVTLPTVQERTGYTFEGWWNGNTYEGGSGNTSNTTFTSSATITARWKGKTCPYTVTYKTNKGVTLFADVTGSAAFGSTVTLTAKSAKGYSPNASTAQLKITKESGNVYNFIYTPIQNVIKFSVGTYGNAMNDRTYTIENGNFYLDTPTIKSGYADYSFIGWTGGGITSPTVDVQIKPASATYPSTTTYTAHYERVSKWWKGENWRPIMETYVKQGNTWKLVPKGSSYVKRSTGWAAEDVS